MSKDSGATSWATIVGPATTIDGCCASGDLIENALDLYNNETLFVENAYCDLRQLQLYAEIHHRLTSRYLGRHGYAHRWPEVRSWTWP
ncbi:hypothetical protein BOX37_22630 [Nocardia mangyaensis]|uniref:Uncharacterized protein n=1 Tax=Nocardia mangyaensis TaxID=2213200 RepID=A0A1J0VW72_9NOCA|nr:hypothetical protein [Nocardia mangyaensis]APE36257.1 hypothetical protein BOX37_22630 [Nocardia mangyaensis]